MAKKKKSSSKSTVSGALLSRLSSPSGGVKKSKNEEASFDFEAGSFFSLPSAMKLLGTILILVGILEMFTLFSAGGYLGKLILDMSIMLGGILGYTAPFVFILVGYCTYTRTLPPVPMRRALGAVGVVLSALALPNLFSHFENTSTGGIIGNILAVPFNNLFSFYPSVLFLVFLFLYSLTQVFGYVFETQHIGQLRNIFSGIRLPTLSLPALPAFSSRTDKVGPEEEYTDEGDTDNDLDIRSEILKKSKTIKKINAHEGYEYGGVEPKRQERKPQPVRVEPKRQYASVAIKDFIAPPLSLLEKDSGKASVGDTKANMSVIKRTLAEFGIQVEMDEVSIGPSVTRYTLKPAQGVKLSRIANHRQELAYALRAESIRIEAPIPGKALVGIEIPNEKKSMVGLGSLLSEPGWLVPAPLLVALGKGISGNALYSNLAKMPHLLIAGTTGSGKSVMVHAIINSLLFRNSPEALKFIMVDPKKVELTIYNNIPHLYTPVITNAKLAIRTLNWAVNEMEHRYDTLEEEGVRDIAAYHKDVYQKALASKRDEEGGLPARMPYIIIIIDELADIMMSYPKELEAAIVRLAQKSRAVGIHLILSTQRPSVNVITGLIKANIPSRIALKVASQIDSRTIIDTAGAEQLLGQGDLLFTSSENPKQERVQSAFVSDNEVKRVVEYLKKTYRDMAPDEINIEANSKGGAGSALFSTEMGSVSGGDTDDDLFEEAKEIVISSRKASTSYLQRRLKVGYSRAARLMDMLEEQGVIGPGDGAKAREVLGGAPEMSERNIDEDELL